MSGRGPAWRWCVLGAACGWAVAGCAPAGRDGEAATDWAEPDRPIFVCATVVEVKGRGVTVREYDFVEDREVRMRYEATRGTSLVHLDRLADLQPGDTVALSYRHRGVARVLEALARGDCARLPWRDDLEGAADRRDPVSP